MMMHKREGVGALNRVLGCRYSSEREQVSIWLTFYLIHISIFYLGFQKAKIKFIINKRIKIYAHHYCIFNAYFHKIWTIG